MRRLGPVIALATLVMGGYPSTDTYFNVYIQYQGEIANTDAFITYNEIDKNLNKLLATKPVPVYGELPEVKSTTRMEEECRKLIDSLSLPSL